MKTTIKNNTYIQLQYKKSVITYFYKHDIERSQMKHQKPKS